MQTLYIKQPNYRKVLERGRYYNKVQKSDKRYNKDVDDDELADNRKMGRSPSPEVADAARSQVPGDGGVKCLILGAWICKRNDSFG
jgi:hypothetical protein